MKLLSILAAIGSIFKSFGFIYRLIGIAICFAFFTGSFSDLWFLVANKGAEAITIEELKVLDHDDIPRYLKLKNVMLYDGNYVETRNEDSESLMSVTYPVYSMEQVQQKLDSLNIVPVHSYVIVKDNDFVEDSLSFIMTIGGKYDDESFQDEKDVLVQNGVGIDNNAILIVKEKPPSLMSSLIISLLTFLGGLILLASFIPSPKGEVVDEEE